MVKVSIRSADRTKIISVFVAPMTPGTSEADFMERFKNKWFGAGTGKSQVEERTRIDGHVAYRFKDMANLNGKLVHRADTLVVDAGKLYQINVLGTVTDPLLDPAVKQCVESFHFLTPRQTRAKP
jgi:hypothetical protein